MLADLQLVLIQSKKILNEYGLCDYCLGRFFVKKLHLSSAKNLGKKIKTKLGKDIPFCYVCKNKYQKIPEIVTRILEKLDGYEFATFVIGAKIKPSISDRDDILRSRFKLKGVDSFKTDFTNQVGKIIAKKTTKKIDHIEPDIVITYDFKFDSIEITSRPIYFFGTYVKKQRGLSQKQKSCKTCHGKGCLSCNYHGMTEFDSVEGQIFSYLQSKIDCKQVKFTWLGGEDKSSLVLGKGRPFFAKVISPKKRLVTRAKNVKLDGVILKKLESIARLPSKIPSFESKIRLKISSQGMANLENLENLGSPVVVYEESGKRSEKQVKILSYDGEPLDIVIKSDGGLPIKRFVEGNEVYPNLSDLLGVKCRCTEFDFLDVTVK